MFEAIRASCLCAMCVLLLVFGASGRYRVCHDIENLLIIRNAVYLIFHHL